MLFGRLLDSSLQERLLPARASSHSQFQAHSLSPQAPVGLQESAQKTSQLLPHPTNWQRNQRATGNRCQPPAHLHPPQPSSLQASRAPSPSGLGLPAASCQPPWHCPALSFLILPPSVHPFEHGRIVSSFLSGLLILSYPKSMQSWWPPGTTPSGHSGLSSTL